MAWPAFNDFNDIKLDSQWQVKETAVVALYILNTEFKVNLS